ncbi:MAG: hypothetical protein HZB50_05520 [Chloroflexi bacterium]|nr:hypothetical protein [Chloroflexota bacterium]
MNSPRNSVGFVGIVFITLLMTACQPAVQFSTPYPTITITFSQTTPPHITPTSADTPTVIPSPISTPTLTSTLQPPLIQHEWWPERVMVSLKAVPGDGGYLTAIYPPQFILYADGSMFATRFIEDGQNYRGQLFFKKVGRKEICQNLNTLDQIGFLNYDPLSYQFPGGRPNTMGGDGVAIRVNAWEALDGAYYALPIYLDNELTNKLSSFSKFPGDGLPVILPALRTAYYFLSEYSMDEFELYTPDRLAVWIQPLDQDSISYVESEGGAKEWRLKTPSFANMFAKIDYDNYPYEHYLVLTDEEAVKVYRFLGGTFGEDIYYELKSNGEKKYFTLFARPVLPYELPGKQIPAPNSTKPNFKLICYPSDGVLPIPTPSIP